MNKSLLYRILLWSLNSIGIIGLIFALFFIISFASKRLLEDKKSVSKIDEGKYILNRMADEYENYLREKGKNLDIERLSLLNQKELTKSKEEKRLIEEKLKSIENEKKSLNDEFYRNEREKKKIEDSLKGTQENLERTKQEIVSLNQKNLDLTVKYQSLTEYWKNYVKSIQSGFNDIYKFNLKKKNEINTGFEEDNGKIYIINEIKDLYSTVSTRDNRVDEISKEKDNMRRELEKQIKEIEYERDKKIKDLTNEKEKLLSKINKANEEKINELIREKDKQINQLIKGNNEKIDNLKNQVDKINKDNSNLKDQLKKIQNDFTFYESFYKEYSRIIEKFSNILKTFRIAEELYKKIDYQQALIQYEKILSEFKEINDSYQKIKNINLNLQNQLASELYKKALENYNKHDYISSYNFFSDLLKNAPESSYVKDSLDKLLLISKLLNDKERENIDNVNAQRLFREAVSLINRKEYKSAMDKYKEIIITYPYSKQTETALNEYEKVYEMIRKSERDIYDKELGEKFNENYKQFSRYYKEGNTEKARKYYFLALQDAFNKYTNFSINNFKEIEDNYIELLIKLNEKALKEKYSIE